MDLNENEDFFDLALFGLMGYSGLLAIKQKRGRSERQQWVRELNLSRDVEGFYALNYIQMQERDPLQFHKITRMRPEVFELLRTLVEPASEKTSWRKPISPSCRLFIVLLYLSQGVPKRVLAWIFKMGYSTKSKIIYETCDIMWTILMPLYLSPPTQENWIQFANDFYNVWNLKNCVSAIDGKHININCPPNAGSEYYNYKGHHSIVLLTACDATYTFTAVDIGAYGSQSDGGTFAESSFGRKLLSGKLNLPPPAVLPNSNTAFNYYLVGDSAFPLKPYLMRPYPGRLLDAEKNNFNKRLSRARRVIENSFGILVARWRILQTTLNMLPENAERIVKASVVLHNFIKVNDSAYFTPEYIDTYDDNDQIIHRGQWHEETNPLPTARGMTSNFSSNQCLKLRDDLKKYLFANKI